MDDPVYALFVGVGLVLAAVSDNWRSHEFDSPPIGMPAAEAWPDGWSSILQAAMREAYTSGVSRTLDCGLIGLFDVVPVAVPGRGPCVALRQTFPAPTPGSRRGRSPLASARS